MRTKLVSGFALVLAASLSAKDLADYKVGDKVTQDILTPVPLKVIDPQATEELKLKEEMRTPVILRFDPTASERAEVALRDAFALQRGNFLNAVEAAYNRRKLGDAAFTNSKFQRLLVNYNKKNKSFTLTTNLAELWAKGDPGRVVQAALIARVQEAMEHPIRPNAWPDELKPKLSFTLRMVPVTSADEVITLETVDKRGTNMQRSALFTLPRARTNLQAQFPDEEKGFAKLAMAALQPNYNVDLALTRESRAIHTAPILAGVTFEAGQPIAREGQVVDRTILAAIDQLREKTTPVRLQEQMTVQQAQAAQVQRRSEWLIAGLGAIAVFSVLVIWRLTRRRPVETILPVKATSSVVEAGQETVMSNAEVRAGLIAQLSSIFRQKLVRGLVTQRGQLLDAQQTAAAEMAELERRLNTLQAPLQDRLRAYETRIAELEKALAAKGDENRELIKAKIVLIRRHLEAERSRNRLVLN